MKKIINTNLHVHAHYDYPASPRGKNVLPARLTNQDFPLWEIFFPLACYTDVNSSSVLTKVGETFD